MRRGRDSAAAVLAVVGAVALLPGVASVARADDWAQGAHDAQRTNRASSSLDPAALRLRWNNPAYHSPLIVGNTLFATSATSSFNLAAFDVDTGAVKWQSAAGTDLAEDRIAYGWGLLVYAALSGSGSQLHTDLYVRDATTGALKYTTPLAFEDAGRDIVMGTDTATGRPVAYVATGLGNVQAVRLDASAGTVLWSDTGISAGNLSILGDSLLTATVEHYYRIDRSSGAVTTIKSGNLSGGRNITPVVDAARRQFYINGNEGSINAYSYDGAGGPVVALWSKSGAGIRDGTDVSLDVDGHVYANDENTLVELDPASGTVVDSVGSSRFAIGAQPPIVSDNAVYAFTAYNDILGPDLTAYSRSTLDPLVTIAGDHSRAGTTYQFASAMDGTHFVFDESGISVYSAPEPGPISLLLVGALAATASRRRRLSAAQRAG